MHSSGYSVFHDGDTPNQLSLSWQSYFCQYLNTKTSTQDNRGYTTKIPSISYVIVQFAVRLTLGLGLGQINNVGVNISLQRTEREIGDRHVTW